MNYYKRVFFLGVVTELSIYMFLSWFPLYEASGRIVTVLGTLMLFLALFYYLKIYLHVNNALALIIRTLITTIPFILVMIFVIFYYGISYTTGASQNTFISYFFSMCLVLVLLSIFPFFLSFFYSKLNRLST